MCAPKVARRRLTGQTLFCFCSVDLSCAAGDTHPALRVKARCACCAIMGVWAATVRVLYCANLSATAPQRWRGRAGLHGARRETRSWAMRGGTTLQGALMRSTRGRQGEPVIRNRRPAAHLATIGLTQQASSEENPPGVPANPPSFVEIRGLRARIRPVALRRHIFAGPPRLRAGPCAFAKRRTHVVPAACNLTAQTLHHTTQQAPPFRRRWRHSLGRSRTQLSQSRHTTLLHERSRMGKFDQFRQIRPDFGQVWPNPAPNRPNLARNRPDVAQNRPNLARNLPNLAGTRPESARIIGQVRTTLPVSQPLAAQLWSKSSQT